jgi:hypothetical protein
MRKEITESADIFFTRDRSLPGLTTKESKSECKEAMESFKTCLSFLWNNVHLLESE